MLIIALLLINLLTPYIPYLYRLVFRVCNSLEVLEQQHELNRYK